LVLGLFGSSKKSEEGDLISKKGDYFDKEISESDKIDEITLKKLLKEGDDYFDSGKFDDALVCFDNLTKIDSEYAVGWKAKGLTLKKLDRIEEAKTCFDRALEIDPKNISHWRNKGAVFANTKNFNESVICFDRALEIDPEDVGTLFDKGSILKKIDRMEEAKTCFERALKISETQKNKKYRQKIKQVLDQINEEKREESKYKISPIKLHHNYYEILGISKNATQKEIKTRFSELMLKFHPDKESSSLSKDMTLKIVEAYNILRDIEKRKQYDLKIR